MLYYCIFSHHSKPRLGTWEKISPACGSAKPWPLASMAPAVRFMCCRRRRFGWRGPGTFTVPRSDSENPQEPTFTMVKRRVSRFFPSISKELGVIDMSRLFGSLNLCLNCQSGFLTILVVKYELKIQIEALQRGDVYRRRHVMEPRWECQGCRPHLRFLQWFAGEMGSPRFICAPMVGQSELPFRLMLRKAGCDLCYTPMMCPGQRSGSSTEHFFCQEEVTNFVAGVSPWAMPSMPNLDRWGMLKNLQAELASGMQTESGSTPIRSFCVQIAGKDTDNTWRFNEMMSPRLPENTGMGQNPRVFRINK